MKRFTDTDKWEDKWFRNLKPNEKLLFLYLIDKCNLAGFIEIDIPLISFYTGLSEEDILGAKQGLNRGYLGADNHIWIKNFLKHQKNLPLNPDNNAHKHILLCLSEQSGRFKLKEIFNYLGADMGLISPIGIGKGKGKGIKGNNLTMEQQEKFKEILLWVNDFNVYFEQTRQVFETLSNDKVFLQKQSIFYPGSDIKLSMAKSFSNYWGVEEGWKNKRTLALKALKKNETYNINWKSTLSKTLNFNLVKETKC